MSADKRLKRINLERIISKMVNKCENIGEIYFFGSRAYQTHSRRSDFDLIIFAEPNKNIDRRSLVEFMSEYDYLDLFIGSINSIVSLSNDSYINLRSNYSSIIDQLDAVKLWDYNAGFNDETKCLLVQELMTGSTFPKSELNSNDPSLPIYKFFKKYSSQLDDKKKTFLGSGVAALYSMNPLAFIAIAGSFFESSLINLFEAYRNRVVAKGFNLTNYDRDVTQTASTNRLGIYRRMNTFLNFIDNNDSHFYRLYLAGENSTFISTTFDIVRRFRNEVDHTLNHNFSMNDCNVVVTMFERHLPLIYDCIQSLLSNPAL